MRLNFCGLLTAAALGGLAVSGLAEIRDDFSGKDWRILKDTPGEISSGAGFLSLRDQSGKPDWVTAIKTFEVNLDTDPVFEVKVKSVSRGAQVKLTRVDTKDKQIVFNIGKPGIYHCNLRDKFNWTGKLRLMAAVYATGDGSSVTYEYLRFAAAPTEVATVKGPALELVPLFISCGYYWHGPKQDRVEVSYRRKDGGGWLPALAPVWAESDGMYRGSIVNLAENTAYEFRLTGNEGKVLAQEGFRTWADVVPVARTVVLEAGNFSGNLKIREKGRPDGWIRYTAAPGFVLKNQGGGPLIELAGAEYVLLDDLTFQGGERNVITIDQCSHVRVRNCDISGWGRVGKQRFDLDGKFYDAAGRAINYDGAILISKSYGTVVERCYIHDPRSRANSWRYSHPAGPEGLMIDKPQATVLRFNDIIGSDEHRWNDAVEGTGNFHADGGFNRDADIYGNMMIYSNDDCIELDGGQQNVRCFMNKFEGALCGVSIQGCMTGPSYVFRNLIVNMGEEFGAAGQSIKTSSPGSGKDAVAYVFNNTICGHGSGLALLSHLKVVAMNNIFAGTTNLTGRDKSPRSITDGNLCVKGLAGEEKNGVIGQPGFVDPSAGDFSLLPSSPAVGRGLAIPDFAPGVNGKVDIGAIPFGSGLNLPYRPVPFTLDRTQANFTLKNGRASAPVTITAAVGGKDFSGRYTVRQNAVADWFEVTPSSGIFKTGEKVAFTVRLRPEKMTSRRGYHGAFLVRLDNGLSRPVTVYAQSDFAAPICPAGAGIVASREAEQPSGGTSYPVFDDPRASGGKALNLDGEKNKDAVEYAIDLPEAGKYFIVIRVRSEIPVGAHDSILFSLNGSPLQRANLSSSDVWCWSPVSDRGGFFDRLKLFDLKKGRNVIRIAPRESVYVDMIALTSDPGLFEQR